MSLSLIVILIGLALLDSLNPFTFAAQAYLLGTKRPLPRSLAFLVGTFLTYFLAGVAVLAGWSAVLGALRAVVPALVWAIAEIAVGIGLVAYGVWSWRRAAQGRPVTLPASLGVGATLAFAVFSTAQDLPTAIPYLAAVDRIAAASLGWVAQAALLTLYNFLYVLPLIGLVVLKVALKSDRSESLFARMTKGVDWAFAKLLPPLAGVAGLALVLDGIRRLA